MKFILFLGLFSLACGQIKRYSGWNTGSYGKLGGTTTNVNKGACNPNCKTCACNIKKEDSLCKTINVQNKWVVDAANCVSYCVRQSNENSGGYCKNNMCYCSKIEKPPVVTSLCETINVNGKWVVDASHCVSKCVHTSAENSGGYCKNNNCFCQKREVPKPPIIPPTPTLCETVYINGKWITDEKSCEAHCVFTSHENIGGYCKSDTCFCKQRELSKPSLCESIYVNGKWITDESTCSTHCVHSSHENIGGYCQADTCYCKQALKTMQKPLCQQVKVNYKWVTDSSACTSHCYQSTRGMKRIGYCQNSNCYCK